MLTSELLCHRRDLVPLVSSRLSGEWPGWAAAGFVLPSHRGKGIGASLLRALAAHAKSVGFQVVYCGTSTAQVSSRAPAGSYWRQSVTYAGNPIGIDGRLLRSAV